MTGRRALFAYAARSGWMLRTVVVVGWFSLALVVTAYDAGRLPGVYPALACVGVLAGIALSQVLQRSASLVRLGSRTLPVYLAHTPIVILFAAGVAAVGGSEAARAVAPWLPPAAALVAILLALGLHRVSTRPPLTYLFEPPPRLLVARPADPVAER